MSEEVSHVEEVLAFVHDTKTWRDMETDERLEWCRRVALVLDNSTNSQFGEWSQTALAPVLGVARSVVTERLAWSEKVWAGDLDRASKPHGGARSSNAQAGDALRFFNNPTVVGERKAEIVAAALADDYVAEQVAARISGDPDLLVRLEKARKRLDAGEKTTEPTTLADEWQRWLTRLNNILTEGARLAERTGEDTTVIPQVALYAYELITEKKIDAELRVLLEAEGVH